MVSSFFNKRLFQKVEPYLYLLPALIVILTFTYYPFLQNVINSTYIVNAAGLRKNFVGLENYRKILTNPVFLQAIKNTIIFAACTIPFSLIVGLILALIAREKTKLSPVYEALFSLPMAMSLSVMAVIFQLMLTPTLGIVNRTLGLEINWLRESLTALPALIAMEVWLNIGFNFLFLLTAIRNIPEEILESAKMDGANRWVRLYQIILPCISPTMLFLIVSSIAKEMIASGLTLILTQGGPDGKTETIVSFIYKNSILNQNYNGGYAASVIGFVLTFIFVLISFIYEKKGVHYV